jgi:DNA-binding PadR family transcriptional regulator
MSSENTQQSIRVVPSDVDQSDLRRILCLRGFQRDLLFVLARLAGTHPNGVVLREKLDEISDETVTEARLYQNLRELSERGYVVKRPIDGRTNAYRIQEDTRRSMREYLDWCESCLRAPYLPRGADRGVVIRGDDR